MKKTSLSLKSSTGSEPRQAKTTVNALKLRLFRLRRRLRAWLAALEAGVDPAALPVATRLAQPVSPKAMAERRETGAEVPT